MFGFIKLLIGTVVTAACAYVFFFVPMGDKTLYRHLTAIAKTPQAAALKDGVRQTTSRWISGLEGDTAVDASPTSVDDASSRDASSHEAAASRDKAPTAGHAAPARADRRRKEEARGAARGKDAAVRSSAPAADKRDTRALDALVRAAQ